MRLTVSQSVEGSSVVITRNFVDEIGSEVGSGLGFGENVS